MHPTQPIDKIQTQKPAAPDRAPVDSSKKNHQPLRIWHPPVFFFPLYLIWSGEGKGSSRLFFPCSCSHNSNKNNTFWLQGGKLWEMTTIAHFAVPRIQADLWMKLVAAILFPGLSLLLVWWDKKTRGKTAPNCCRRKHGVRLSELERGSTVSFCFLHQVQSTKQVKLLS